MGQACCSQFIKGPVPALPGLTAPWPPTRLLVLPVIKLVGRLGWLAFSLITGLIPDSDADGVGVLRVGWLGLSLLLADGCCVGRDAPCVNKTKWGELWSLSVSWFTMLWSDCS